MQQVGVEVAPGAPAALGHVFVPRHRQLPHGVRPALYLPVQPLYAVVGAYPPPSAPVGRARR